MRGLVESEEIAGTVFCACFNLRRTARAVTSLFDHALEGTRIKATQFTLLSAMHLTGPVPITLLAEGLGMDRTTLTRNLVGLERQGFVEVIGGEDRRTKLLRLTPLGREAYAEAFPIWRRIQEKLVEAAGQERWDQLLADLFWVSRSACELAEDGDAGLHDRDVAHRGASR